MFRSWSIADGPAELTDQDIGQTLTIRVRRPHQKTVYLRLEIGSVGTMHGGDVKSFSGKLHLSREIVDVTGTYNTNSRSGNCHTSVA